MKRLLIAATALAGMTAAPAFAATGSTTTITGNVEAVCDITPANTAINVGTLSADSNGQVSVTGATAPFENLGNGFCNGVNSTVSVSATPLTTPGEVPAAQANDFTNRVDISFGFKVDGVRVAGGVDTAGAGTGITAAPVGLFNGQVGTDTDLAPANTGGRRLVAGAYTGSITYTFAAAS